VSACHKNPTVLFGKLYLCGLSGWEKLVEEGVEVLVPLDHLPGGVWELGFRGEIMYIPILDGYILPEDVLEHYVNVLIKRLEEGKRVGVFCIGGHGRTGYLAGALLYTWRDIKDPIAYLRENYCPYAVETNVQVEALMHYTGEPGLSKYLR